MIINLNSSINYGDTPIMDGLKFTTGSQNTIFLPQDFFVLDEHFFEIGNNGIINVKQNIICNIFGFRSIYNDGSISNFIMRKNNVVEINRTFPTIYGASDFIINAISFLKNDKIQFFYEGLGLCKFYLKI